MTKNIKEEEKNSIYYADIPETSYYGENDYNLVVERIKMGNVNPNSTITSTPENLKMDLKLHQKRLLFEMKEKEKMLHRTSNGINMGVISDKVGSGKSVLILALIADSKCVENNNMYSNKMIHKPPRYASFYGFDYNKENIINTNLIVVPHNIYHQWCEYINRDTNLKFYGISTVNDLRKLDINELNNYDITLVKSTKYTEFMNLVYEINGQIEYKTVDYRTQLLSTNDKSGINMNLKKKLYSAYCSFSNQTFGMEFVQNLQSIKDALNQTNINEMEDKLNIIDNYLLDNVRYIDGPIFQRVIIDEADSIRIPNCPVAYGLYNWFVTSSVEDLLYPSGKKDYYSNKIIAKGITGLGFIKQTFAENCRRDLVQFMQHNFLKNNDKFVEDSFNLPDPIYKKIECYTPPELKILHDVAIPEVVNALNAGDKESAIKMAGCQVSNENSIVDIVLSKLNNDLKNKEAKIEEKKSDFSEINKDINKISTEISELNQLHKEGMDHVYSVNEKKEIYEKLKSKKSSCKKSIENLENQCKDIKFKLDSMKTRITNIDEKECPICSDIVNNPAMTPCCKNIFCFECITMAINFDSQHKNQCPFCRQTIKLSNLTVIDTKKKNIILDENEENKLPTKIESLISIIKEKENGKFLVFSEYDNTFPDIVCKLEENNITYSHIYGSGGHIKNIVNSYKNGDIKVLFLNAKHYGSGLNLQMSTDIIVYHRMTKDLEMQVIGRGQRLGRSDPLTVNYLCYEHEI